MRITISISKEPNKHEYIQFPPEASITPISQLEKSRQEDEIYLEAQKLVSS